MQYIFFDIECACVYRSTAKICAFGYCVTDEKLNLLKKEDLLIDPKGKFHLTDGRGEEGIVLPYDYREFKNYPPFPKVFPRIRALLEGEGKRIFGHATCNDVKYLNLETKRFHLPALSFEFFDTQVLYMALFSAFDRQPGLESIAQALGVEFVPHRAADDAYATMRVARAMCEREGLSLEELLKKYAVEPGKTSQGSAMGGTSRGYEAFQTEKKRLREERGKRRERFSRLVDRKNGKKNVCPSENVWRGKVFHFSGEIEEDFDRAKGYVEEIYRRGGRYGMRTGDCNVYVRAQTDDGRRYRNALSAGIQIVEEAEFLKLLTERNA